MIVGKDQVRTIVQSMADAGAFERQAAGLFELKQAPKACTYLG
jgi:hypothetical protein